MELTSESVLALAPDASSVKAAQALLKPGQWPTLGFNENAVWGECKGSGSKPYQVEADLSGPVFKCTCPSRKFPCKHSLALLLLRVQQEAAFTQGEAPDWVKEWLDARENALRVRSKSRKTRASPPIRRSSWARGVPPSNAWLPAWTIWSAGCATSHHGLGQLSGTPAWQEEAAARMVDAQLPGIAARLRSLQGVTSSGRTGLAWCWPSLGSCSPHRRLPPP
ncbi:MAG: SWIM zinc finger family protein [Bilophila wadsworthia]